MKNKHKENNLPLAGWISILSVSFSPNLVTTASIFSSFRILIVTIGASEDAFTTIDPIGGMPALKTVTRAGISRNIDLS